MANVLVEEEEEEEEEEEATETCDPCVALRLVAAASWHVVRKRRVYDFPLVLSLLEAVGDAAPDLVHFRHLAKLRLGLQAKMIMTMLQEEQPHGKIYDAIDTYFPECSPQPHPKATAQDLVLVQAAQENFRDLVLELLSDRRRQEKYVQEHLENDYGEAFSRVVEELFCDYLWQLESTLPEPDLQQLMEAACTLGPRQSPQPDPSILSYYLTVMGYQVVGFPTHPSSSSPLFHSDEDEEDPRTPELCKAQPSPDRSRTGQSCPPCAQEGDSHGHHSSNQETDGSEEVVLDSSSEGSSSPFKKGEYQCTWHNTLIPTFQEHRRGRCVRCLDSIPSPGTCPPSLRF